MRSLWRLVCVFGLMAHAAAAEPVDAIPLAPVQILERAFQNAYELDRRAIVDLTVEHSGGTAVHRRLELASKRISGRLHSVGFFVEPTRLRGTRILSIENPERSDDHFLYLPSMRKVKRVTSAQNADSFMGTDLTYEDFERRRIADYEILEHRLAKLHGETVHIVRVKPRSAAYYSELEFAVASADFAILESRYFKKRSHAPFKVMYSPRQQVAQLSGHALPTRMVVENHERQTRTVVKLDQLAVNPELEDSLFDSGRLERLSRIPGFE